MFGFIINLYPAGVRQHTTRLGYSERGQFSFHFKSSSDCCLPFDFLCLNYERRALVNDFCDVCAFPDSEDWVHWPLKVLHLLGFSDSWGQRHQ